MIQAPKGTKDVLPQDSYLWQWIEQEMRDIAAKAGYREIRTPVFEHTELFLRGVGDTTDIVQKEMYTFEDKGKRSITLKPEGTAGVVRAVIENRLYADTLPVKAYYLNCPIFRYENPQSGRLREHHQFGMEFFGSQSPSADAELIIILLTLLKRLGLKNLVVHMNSNGCEKCRPNYHEALRAYLKPNENKLCDVCKTRIDRNPLRVLDCKVDADKPEVKNAPVMLEYLCEECDEHFHSLKAILDQMEVPYTIDTRIVRGLDYYTKTVFEITMQTEGRELALCGGGRYDNLVSELDGPKIPAVGFGLGTERIMIEMQNQNIVPEAPAVIDVFVCSLQNQDRQEAFRLSQSLRTAGFKADSDHMNRSLKAQFKYADKVGSRHVVIVGGDEETRGAVAVRNMQTKEQTEVTKDNLIQFLIEKGN